MKLILITFLFLYFPLAQATCWDLSECYSIDFKSKKTKGSLSFGKNGLKFLNINNTDKDFYCMSNIQDKNLQCEYFYHCKPLNYKKQNNMDLDSNEFVEIKWVVKKSKPLGHALIKRSNVKSPSWEKVSTEFKHWKSISSGSPTCSLNTIESSK